MMNRIEEFLMKVLRHWLTYYILAWLAAVGASAVALEYARTAFVNPDRRDGNGGHATIDFGGQYLMGRMLVTGHGRQLYNRYVQRQVLEDVYPDDDSKPPDREDPDHKSDVQNLMYWMMGDRNDGPAKDTLGSLVTPLAATDSWQAAGFVLANEEQWTEKRLSNAIHPVGGPLYPPVNAIVYAPLGLMQPRLAYRVQQVFNLVMVFVAAAGASYLTRGRTWVPVLAIAILLFPGYAGSINLGQNAIVTLVFLIWGWALAARGRPMLGGMVWGLLAFKPVWALAFLLVPLLSRRWRFGLGMVATGAGLALLTVPFVGVHSWFDWLAIGREATDTYDRERNWIFLSRDLLSVPRRYLISFEYGYWDRLEQPFKLFGRWDINVSLLCHLIGWAMLVFVLENTLRLAVLRRKHASVPDGPPAAFLCLGAWMCCFHFMYYDALLGALGLFLLFTEPQRYLSPLLVALAPLRNAVAGPANVAYREPGPPEALPPPVELTLQPRSIWTLNRMAPTAVLLLLLIHYVFPVVGLGSHWGTPWDTFTLAGVWAWSGWQWLRHGEKVATSWDDPQPAPLPFDVEEVVDETGNGEATGKADEAIRAPLTAGDAP